MPQDALIPTYSPFNYNIGINYDSWNPAHPYPQYDPGPGIIADLGQITANFKLIKTYHDTAVATGNPTPTIDPTQQVVITYVTGNPGLQLVMGTNVSAIVEGGPGAWSAGLMAAPPATAGATNPYTDAWAQMLITAFGGVSAVQSSLAMILLGNELDQAGPPPGDPSFAAYQTWIDQSFTNLSLSLANAGLGSIPISTTIANYASTNSVAAATTKYILDNWSSNWNNNAPIVLFNQYTQAGTFPSPPPDGLQYNEAESTAYLPVITYFGDVQTEISAINASAELFVGETGYSAFWDAAAYAPTANPPGQSGPGSQATVYNKIFTWLGAQYANGHQTTPVFLFQAYDIPAGDPVQAQYGIYDPTNGLQVTLPSWVSLPTNTQFGTTGNDILVGGAGNDTFYSDNGNDRMDGGAGRNTSIQEGATASYTIRVAAGATTLVVQDKTGTDGTDQLANIQNVQFTDKTIVASWITKAASLPAAQILKVVDLYTAGLGRAPDSLGLDYWASRLADGTKIADISKAIFGSAEAAPIYSQANSDPVFVNLVYQMALGHAADAAGQTYWMNALNAGQLARTDLVTALVAGAQGTDKQYIANREAVGAHFALTAGLNNLTWARTVESAVTGTAASVTAANAQTDTFATIAAAPATSELVVQIVGLVP